MLYVLFLNQIKGSIRVTLYEIMGMIPLYVLLYLQSTDHHKDKLSN